MRYYRVTAYDNHAGKPNESWYSDSVGSATPIYAGPVWYASSDTGSDTVAGTGSGLHPYRTIFRALQMCNSGETVQLMACANVFSESVVVTKDTVAIVGMGRSRSIISPGGVSGITANGHLKLTIRDLEVINAYNSNTMFLTNNTNTLINKIKITNCKYGIYLDGNP
ncbi:MAG TPA: hypothetical protein PKM88_11830, partial [bacterium]|nr:hypothetical protein [bacterium]